MATQSISRRTLLAAGALPLVSGCVVVPVAPPRRPGQPPQVLSQAMAYAGAPVPRLYVYVFVDVRPKLIGGPFHDTAKAMLAQGLQRSGVPSEQFWLYDVPTDKIFWNETLPLGASRLDFDMERVITENAAAEKAFAPTHRLTLFPYSTRQEGWGEASMDIQSVLQDLVHYRRVWTESTRVERFTTAQDGADFANFNLERWRAAGFIGAAG